MAELELGSKMLVREVMSSPVLTVKENDPANEVAKLMAKNNIGCLIVDSAEGKPIGIITEKDLVVRVVAKNIHPSKITAKLIMSSPLLTIDPESTISDAARRMNFLNVRRLAVMYKGKLAGIVANKDILAVTPELIEIILEKARIKNQNLLEETENLQTGHCDNCGSWSDNLKEFEGNFLCYECRSELLEV